MAGTGVFHIIRDGIIFELEPEDGGGFVISVPTLQGCISFGETIDEAMRMIDDAMALWLEVARERGLDIPRQFSLQPAS
jgi:predicted RNase H-like HicB family nuclease